MSGRHPSAHLSIHHWNPSFYRSASQWWSYCQWWGTSTFNDTCLNFLRPLLVWLVARTKFGWPTGWCVPCMCWTCHCWGYTHSCLHYGSHISNQILYMESTSNSLVIYQIVNPTYDAIHGCKSAPCLYVILGVDYCVPELIPLHEFHIEGIPSFEVIYCNICFYWPLLPILT